MILASESDSQAHTPVWSIQQNTDVPTNGIETKVYIIVKKKKKQGWESKSLSIKWFSLGLRLPSPSMVENAILQIQGNAFTAV